MISDITELVISPKWGSCSETSFTVYKQTNGKYNPWYDKLRKTRLIHIEGFGYFTIVSDDENFENKIPNKQIIAYSAEYLLNNKGINLTFITTAGSINDSDSTTIVTSNYFFYRETQPEKSLLHQLIAAAPQWKIGYVSPSLKSKSRSFSETDKGLYGFLTNEVSQSFEALFVFDNENYTVNAYDTTEVIKNTNIVLSFDNLLKNATVKELSDDIYTVINVSGAENLSIAKINPNGTKKLFCLDYYTGVLDKKASNYYENYNEWITDNELKKKVLEWERACKIAIYDKSQGSYGYWTSLQKKFNLLLLTQQAELNQTQTYYDVAQQNMSLYTDYSELDKLQVYAEWKEFLSTKSGYVEYGEAKKNNYTIKDYYQVDQYTVNSNRRITLYAYWKNYSQACESNLQILRAGGKLYSVRDQDFKQENVYNADYIVSSDATIVANGRIISSNVEDHNLTPGGAASFYAIEALRTEISSIQKERDAIVNKYAFENNFTAQEKLALDPFLIEGSFQDDSFIVTDSMEAKDYSNKDTKVEVILENGDMVIKPVGELTKNDTIMDDIYVASQLVDAGYEKLKVVSQPTFSFEAESTNFLFIEKFKPFIDQLTSIEKNKGSLFGSIINIQLEDSNWVYPYLQEIEINYDDPDSFSMSFGNRFRLSDETYTFAELHNETTSAVASVSSLLTAVSQPVTNGTVDAVTRYTKEALIAANQSIKATTDNEFTFGSYGIKGRKKTNDDGNINGFSPEQLWIANNKICFTDDGWKTTKAVFGKITLDGKESYGLIADSIVGRLIMGNNLIISNNSNTFTVNEEGMTITNGDTTISLDPNTTNAFSIRRTSGVGQTDVMTVDNKGSLTINGGVLRVGYGENTGYIIDGQNGTIKSVALINGHPAFELTADGILRAEGLAVGGEVTINKGDIITPSGTGGTVSEDGGSVPPQGGLFQKLEWLLQVLWNPYTTVLGWVGKTDDVGWRKIWGYYSNRDLEQMSIDLAQSGYFSTQSWSKDNFYTKTYIDSNFAKKATLDEYKTWTETQKVLNNYQTTSAMSNYYTIKQTEDTFVTKDSLVQNYYSKTQINTLFDNISENSSLKWATITVNGINYTVLTKE